MSEGWHGAGGDEYPVDWGSPIYPTPSPNFARKRADVPLTDLSRVADEAAARKAAEEERLRIADRYRDAAIF